MYIGEVSQRTGATPRAIRFYEKLGLIPVPDRQGTYRRFRDTDVEKIHIIKQAQKFGFKLTELKKLIHEETSCDDFPWEKAVIVVTDKIRNITAEIGRLKKTKQELTTFAKILASKNCQ